MGCGRMESGCISGIILALLTYSIEKSRYSGYSSTPGNITGYLVGYLTGR